MRVFSSISFDATDECAVAMARADVASAGIKIRDIELADDMTIKVQIKDGVWWIDEKSYSSIDDILIDYLYVPQVFQSISDACAYKTALAKQINILSQQRRETLNTINDDFINNLGAELNSVYEKYTGAIQFEDFEWECIDSTDSLKRFFSSKKEDLYLYLMNTESTVLLRGAAVYYFHAAYGKVNKFGGRENLEHWFNNVNTMLGDLSRALTDYRNNSAYSRRLLLGVVDNLRNLVLIFLNYELLKGRVNKSFILNDGCIQDGTRLGVLISIIYKYQAIIESLVCKKNVDISSLCEQLKEIATSLAKISKAFQNIVKEDSVEWGLYKCFGPLPRENDHYFENFLTIQHCLKKSFKTDCKKHINFVGIMSGALELPFICKYLYSDSDIFLIYQNLGNYFERQSKSASEVRQNIIMTEAPTRYSDTIVLDDNITCGITAQHVINELVYNKFSLKALWCIKHPDIGRATQVIHYGHCLNFEALEQGFIEGILFPASYTKIPENRNIDGYFLNEFGVYSATVDVFLRGLYKNGGFIAGSETDIFKGFNVPKDNEILTI